MHHRSQIDYLHHFKKCTEDESVKMTYLHFIFSILRAEPAPEFTLVKSNGGVAISLVW